MRAKVRIRLHNKVAVVDMEGSFSAESITLFRSEIANLMKEGRVAVVIKLDLNEWLHPAWIEELIECKKTLQLRGGDLKIADTSRRMVQWPPEIARLLGKVLDTFEIYRRENDVIL